MLDKPNVLVATSTFPRWSGDVEPGFVYELARRLSRDFNVYVVCPHARGAKKFEVMDGVYVYRYQYAPDSFETLTSNGGIVANLKKNPIKWLLVPALVVAQIIALLLLIKKIKPACIHAHWIIPQGFAVSIVKYITNMPPILLTSHGGDLFSMNGVAMRKIKSWVAGSVSAMTVVSHAMKAPAIDMGCPLANLYVMPMGVDLQKEFFSSFQLEKKTNQILFVGRLVEKKGLRYLIYALPAVLEKMPDVTLIIAGDGPDRRDLERLTHELRLSGRVRFLGAVEQARLPNLYAQSTLFVAPFIRAESGDEEGLGLVTIEAIGCGCAILVGRVDAVRDILGDSSELILDDVKNITAFSNRILKVLNNIAYYTEATNNIREKVIEEFDWDTVAKKYGQLISQLANSNLV